MLPFDVIDLIWTLLVPGAIGLFGVLLCGWVLPERIGNAYSSSVLIATGLGLACWKLELVELVPQFHWHWFPAAVIAAGLLGPVLATPGTQFWQPVLPAALVGLVAAAFLLPDKLEPSQFVHAQWMAIGFALVTGSVEWLAARKNSRVLFTIMFVNLIAVVMIVGVTLSFSLVRMPLAIAGGLCGVGIASFFLKERSLTGFGLIFAMTLVGFLSVAKVRYLDAPLPIPSLFLIILPVCGVFVGYVPGVTKLKAWKKATVQIVAGIVPIVGAVVWAVVKDPSLLKLD